jgi:hypothetical protein
MPAAAVVDVQAAVVAADIKAAVDTSNRKLPI